MKLIKFPTSTEARIQSHINRLRDDLWNADSGDQLVELLQVIEEYLHHCPDSVSKDIATLNIQTSIVCLTYYFGFE